MLLAVATATIALIAVRAVLGASGEDANRRALDATTRLADATRAQIQAALLLDPEVVFREVLAGEPDRVCASGTSDPVPAGSSWPVSCGATWSYEPADATATVIVLITPPSPSNPELVVSVSARAGTVTAGYIDTYRIGGAQRPTVFSADALDLGELENGTGNTVLRGTVYSGSTLRFDPGVDTAEALLAAESAMTNLAAYPESGGTAIGDRRVATGTPDLTATPARQPLRSLFPTPLAGDALRAATAALAARACPAGVVPANIADATGADRSSALCLKAGTSVVSSEGAQVTVPTAVAWLLLPNATAAGDHDTVDVYYRSTPFTTPACGNCNLRNASEPSLAASNHPGQIAAWTKLATLHLPASGYIGTDATTHIGLCGSGFTATGTCARWGTGEHSGVRISEHLTVVAGTVQRPRDVYLSGPVTAAGGRLGVIATGDVKLPYWSTTEGGSLTVEADIVVLGRGDVAAISSFPSTASAANAAGIATLNGRLAATQLSLAVSTGVFQGTRIETPSPTRVGSLLPAPDLNWGRMSSKRMGALEFAQIPATP